MAEIIKTIYSEAIFKMAKDKIDKMFYNSSMEHAVVVHQALVKYATSYIDIFSGNMCSEISNNKYYCKLMEDFLNKPGNPHVNIILNDFIDTFREKPIAMVLMKYPNQVHIKRSKTKVLYNNNSAHFTIADDKAFRLEIDIEERIAFGNFNSSSKVKVLKDTFDKIFNSGLSEPITTI